jgi:hypothetical protein
MYLLATSVTSFEKCPYHLPIWNKMILVMMIAMNVAAEFFYFLIDPGHYLLV